MTSFTMMCAEEPAPLQPDTPPAPTVEHAFNDKIDSWVEGVVMSVDADAGKFSIRGIKREYATTYATMLKEIDVKTLGMNEADRARASAQIR